MPPASISCTAAASSAGMATGALMSTMPARSGWPSASASVRAPPIESPTTTTRPSGARAAPRGCARPRSASRPSWSPPCPRRRCRGRGAGAARRRSRRRPAPRRAAASTRAAGEAVEHEGAVRAAARRRPRLAAGQDGVESSAGVRGMAETLPGGSRCTDRRGAAPATSRRGRGSSRVGVDAVDRAGVEALVAARAELRDDDHVHPVVEDGPELRRAVPDARVAVDADRHVDEQRRVLPLGVPLAVRDALGPGRSPPSRPKVPPGGLH